MLHSIAVTTDFSQFSRAAFATAADLARRFRARLWVLHVAEEVPIHTAWQVISEPETVATARHSQTEKRLEELARTVPAFADLSVRARVVAGGAAAVERFCRAEGIELVVVASHGHGGGCRFPIGGFAEKVLAAVSCAVLVERSDGRSPERTTGSFRPQRVLVPHDFSHASLEGVQRAVSWIEELGARGRLVFVVDETMPPQGYLAGTVDTVAAYIERLREEGLSRLRRLAEEESGSLELDAVARVGVPALEILEAAKEFESDLIVMPSRDLSTVERLTLGSVTERVLRGTNCSVLVLKAKTRTTALEAPRDLACL